MAVFTPVTVADLTPWIDQFPLGRVLAVDGISSGIENSNFFLTTETGEFILTIFENLRFEQLPFYLQLMRHLATLFAPAIRVNAISPGGVERGQPELFRKRYAARTPLKRMATEEDMKGAIAYLGSDLSAYVTGHNLIVDGGWTAK